LKQLELTGTVEVTFIDHDAITFMLAQDCVKRAGSDVERMNGIAESMRCYNSVAARAYYDLIAVRHKINTNGATIRKADESRAFVRDFRAESL
jgi:hypothetical protein